MAKKALVGPLMAKQKSNNKTQLPKDAELLKLLYRDTAEARSVVDRIYQLAWFGFDEDRRAITNNQWSDRASLRDKIEVEKYEAFLQGIRDSELVNHHIDDQRLHEAGNQVVRATRAIVDAITPGNPDMAEAYLAAYGDLVAAIEEMSGVFHALERRVVEALHRAGVETPAQEGRRRRNQRIEVLAKQFACPTPTPVLKAAEDDAVMKHLLHQYGRYGVKLTNHVVKDVLRGRSGHR